MRHRAAHPRDGQQRCEWCGKILVEWIEELQPRPSPADLRALFFRVGADVIETSPGTMVRGTENDERVPSCIPDVEGVDVR